MPLGLGLGLRLGPLVDGGSVALDREQSIAAATATGLLHGQTLARQSALNAIVDTSSDPLSIDIETGWPA